ncbi:CDP-diacylglycerol--glycerol-3-phosphate 3-phosphatidyltransferase [Nitrospirillum viridazoti]|uniref:CDP-diacylglycerol--glycerol-3-phosphate 3-phosphatidyltransferase n=1 Tax=Nitrospirillum viridazoti CBAmc TaxID=1441467 RepID=A0A248JMC1_9PROT|nr:CDP-diacylglycerol--glycerol-3-phosphate 3-phosphatidyltransferase [Nitrospirillum amazonense]ASG19872.1 CDP-diacylglycerol--glycerol-3-phosphate 3-phosphatidyltransferase [Nitrospirillum amazonense CBAmc]TWB30423.1 cardiolipin synthase [Nitrospirillum amazonense]
MLTSLPNLLTLSRIALIPVILALLWFPATWTAWTAAGLFALAGITDYFDGYLARAWHEESIIGRFLDPIADKLLVAAVLFLLVADHKIVGHAVLPAVIILLREVAVSGLREFLAGLRVGVPVSRLAKWKTAIQLMAIGWLIVGDHGPDWLYVRPIGEIGLWAAAVLTLITGWDYLRAGLRHMLAPAGAPTQVEPAAPKAPAAAPVRTGA